MAWRIVATRFKVGNKTTTYPAKGAEVPDGPYQNIALDPAKCDACGACAPVCPTTALIAEAKAFRVDHGACVACGACVPACHAGALTLSSDFELATRARGDLSETVSFSHAAIESAAVPKTETAARAERERLAAEIARVFGRSLHIREVAAGGCNGCEVEAVNLSNPYYDVERLGVHFVASPRHADMLLVTGPVSWGMADPLRVAYDAMPEPRLVLAVGACGIMGGPFVGSYGVTNGVANVLPVDVFIPGCPPRPEALIHGILLAIGRAEQKIAARTHRAPAGAVA
ncbi:MAG: NADH-quinone oxidoreductase subunit NuoB [Thermoplasmatota archaeon]